MSATATDTLNLQARIDALPDFSLTAYTSMTGSDGDTSPFGSFTISKNDVQSFVLMAQAGHSVDAAEITKPFFAEWSDQQLRTDLDRMEISVAKDLRHCTAQLLAFIDGTDAYIASPCVDFDNLVESIEDAIEAGEDKIWFGYPDQAEEMLVVVVNTMMKHTPVAHRGAP